MNEIIIISIYFITPAILIWLSKKFEIINKIGVVVLSYLFGIAMALSGFLPSNVLDLQETLNTIIIPVSIPLLLFSTDMKAVKNLAGNFLKSLIIGLVSIIISIVSGYYLFMQDSPKGNEIAGLLTGVYTGGTPNLASIKTALDIDSSTYILVHSTDLSIGIFYLLFFLSIAQKLLNKFLVKRSIANTSNNNTEHDIEQIDIVSNFTSEKRKESLIAIIAALVVFGVGGGLSLLFPKEYSTTIAILSITTFSILLSFYKPINKIKQSFSLGMYLILVFSIVVSSMVNFDEIGFETLNLLFYVAWAMIATFILQVVFAKIFDIDADITIITATALSMSPPFVPVVAGALNNKDIVFPGITIGLIGYIIGNYLGIIMAYALN
ncbi:MAG: DUF819 family protein [Flavobacteriales bacterium]|nr:DUF819 family protein [Flavobacteriales bacterium]